MRPILHLVEPEADVHLAGDELGRTYTPDAVALAVVLRLTERLSDRCTVLEPCVGGGAFARAARQVLRAQVHGVDLDATCSGQRECAAFVPGDAREVLASRGVESYDLVLTNPPFGKDVGQEVTEGIVASARRVGVVTAMLMPLDYQTQAGFEHHVADCAEVWPLLPRPFECERGMCVFVWDTRHEGLTLFRPLRWRSGGTASNLSRSSVADRAGAAVKPWRR